MYRASIPKELGILLSIMKDWIIGVDEAGEKAWEAFARGCLVFLEVTKRNADNINSSCREGALQYN